MTELDWHDGTERWTERDGVRLHYVEGGREEPDAPTVLFVHGLTSSARSWDPVVPRIAAGCHVVSVDLRGHGDSGWAGKIPDGYRTLEFARDLMHIVRTIGRGRVHVVGHSLGARIGIVLAGESPDLVQTLILSDTLPEVAPEGAVYIKQMIGDRTGTTAYRTVEEVVEVIAREDPNWQKGQYEHYVRSNLVTNWVGKLIYRCDPQLYWITTGRASRADNGYFWEAAGKIECPTLILWGRRSFLVNQELVDRMLATTTSARDRAFDTGHYILREAPEEWTDEVLRHIGV